MRPAGDAGSDGLTAPAALDILRETAGARLALGRKQATATGLPVGEPEHAWTRAWLQAKEAGYTADDVRRLGLALAERRLWRCERKLSTGDLSRRLLDLLAEAQGLPAEAEARAGPDPPAPVIPCEEGWCDGRFHYEQDPDQHRRPKAFQCPKRRGE